MGSSCFRGGEFRTFAVTFDEADDHHGAHGPLRKLGPERTETGPVDGLGRRHRCCFNASIHINDIDDSSMLFRVSLFPRKKEITSPCVHPLAP